MIVNTYIFSQNVVITDTPRDRAIVGSAIALITILHDNALFSDLTSSSLCALCEAACTCRIECIL
ncbi:MAG: hypothetical protein QNJ72_19630 [Pleurocapsa sp. MO_226.B13]|nr:hypothetical protein [Pleurocapsa sp. MO_226.B13]